MLLLTRAELVELTGRHTSPAQRSALASMGIAYVVAADGRPRVSRAAVEALLAPGVKLSAAPRRVAPRLDLVR